MPIHIHIRIQNRVCTYTKYLYTYYKYSWIEDWKEKTSCIFQWLKITQSSASRVKACNFVNTFSCDFNFMRNATKSMLIFLFFFVLSLIRCEPVIFFDSSFMKRMMLTLYRKCTHNISYLFKQILSKFSLRIFIWSFSGK